jgi:RHS repeat-associated protein
MRPDAQQDRSEPAAVSIRLHASRGGRAAPAGVFAIVAPLDFTRAGALSLRASRHGAFMRLLARMLIRLLLVTTLPPEYQVASVLVPVSILWEIIDGPLVSFKEETSKASRKSSKPHPRPLPKGTDVGEGLGSRDTFTAERALAQRRRPLGDELNRLRSKVYGLAPGDTVGVWQQIGRAEYDPDPNGNVTTMREYVASGTSPPSSTPRLVSRVYDDLDRLQSETSALPDTGSSETVAYTYFGNGTRQTVKDPFAATTTYTYDGQNRLHSVTTADNAQTTYTYLGNGLADQVIYPNGVMATHTYDNANRLKSISNAKGATVINSYAYTYGDGRGNRTQQVETNGGVTESTSYTYDNLDRLATITYPADATFPNGRNVAYTYDGAGNRVGEATTDPQTHAVLDSKTGSFDAVNRLSTLTDNVDASKTSVFGYDADGNTTSKTQNGVTTTYAYDVRDKQVEVKQGGTISGQYIYDCEGRLIRSLDDQGSRQIVNDQTSRFLEIGLSGEQLAKYDYGNRLIRLTNGDGTRFFSFDGLGSATALTDPTGTARNAFHLDAWGNYRHPAELNGTDDRVGFTGYIWSKSTNLYFAKARWYDPEIARFTSQDDFSTVKVDKPPSLQLYFYAAANPTRYVDPTGHDFKLENNWQYTDEGVPYINQERPQIPVLSGTRTDADLNAYTAWMEKNGTRDEYLKALALATSARSQAYLQGAAKVEVATGAAAAGGAGAAALGGGATVVGAVGGAAQGLVSGWLDGVRGYALGARTAVSAAAGGAFGWMASKIAPYVVGEATSVADPGAATADRLLRPVTMPPPAPAALADTPSGQMRLPQQLNIFEDAQPLTPLRPIPEGGIGGGSQAADETPGQLKLDFDDVASGPDWRVGPHGDMPSPRPGGYESHHGVNSVWMEENVPGYKAADAPAVLMRNDPSHNATRGVFNRFRTEMAGRQGVSPRDLDWSEVSPGSAWRLAEEQFDAAKIPDAARAEYWKQFNKYLESLSK